MELIISEKYNAAERIADILSGGAASRTQVKGQSVFTWGNKRCMGLAGHVVEVDFPEDFNDWRGVEPSSLIDAPTEKRPSKKGLVDTLQVLARDADQVIIATDYDREGELIGKEAYELVREVNNDVPVHRVRFSSLTDGEVTDAFKAPESLDFNLAAAGEARQTTDLRWGASLTRFLTLSATQRDELMSAGRVQTPTLKLIVDRKREIDAFDPDDYWEIVANLRERPNGDAFEAQYFYLDDDGNETERLWSIGNAESVHTEIQNAAAARVKNIDKSTQNDNPPVPFSTTEFISAANAIGVDAKPAMNIAEDLYDDGHITYPRTDNTVYPDDLDAESLLESLATINEFQEDAKEIASADELSATEGDEETTDHPPIHPTEDIPVKQALSDGEWRIYELVVRRFFATFADAALWAKLRIDVKTAGHRLKSNGKRLIDPGYHAVYPYFDTDETELPEVDEGAMLEIMSAELQEKQTRPPNRYGQSKLIEKMESLGLGTKSTRHNTVDKLYDRDYITNNPPDPTELAENLISAVEEYAPHVASPDMTAELEADMTAIAEGDKTLDDVTEASRDMLREVFADLEASDDDIAEILNQGADGSGGDGFDEDAVVGDCPDCSEPLIAKNINEARFIGCHGYPDCEYTLSLPNKGRPHVLDDVCEDHGLHHVKMIAGSQTFVYGCAKCKQEEADETDDRVIGDCPDCHESNGGELAIKRVRSGSRLVGCMRFPDCDYSLPLPKNGDIEVIGEICGDHDLPELVVRKEDSSPWNLGCPICNYEDFKSS